MQKTLDDYLNGYTKPSRKKLIIPNLIDGTQSVGKTPKIPANDKEWSPFFAVPLESPKVVLNVNEPDAFYAFIKCLLSKCPHFEYLYFTRSKYFNKKQYFFRDTRRDIVVVMTLEEIKYKIN